MIKVIKRTTDNNYLQSISADTWVSIYEEAFEMTHNECEAAKVELLNTYIQEQLIEMIDFQKTKPMSTQERKSIIDTLLNKNI